MKKIMKIGALQMGKIVAVLYAVIGFFFFIPLAIVAFLARNNAALQGTLNRAEVPARPLALLLMPLLYAVLGFVMSIIGCALFNFIAPKLGGITVDIQEDNVA